VILLGSLSVSSLVASSIVLIEEPVEFRQPLREGSMIQVASVPTPSLPQVALLPERLMLSSLCASASSHVTQSRRNAMGGLIGMTVNTDAAHPEGWYVVPTDGLQWHHLVASTTFALWRGKTTGLTTLQSTERGNRVVIHAQGLYPVSSYTCRISSALTNVASVTFDIGRDSQTQAVIPFNINFVGLNFGPNGVIESTYDPETGIWTQRGDDIVYSNGELPSSVSYHAWVRFGATVVVTVGNPASMDEVKNQFITGSPNLTTELIRSGDTVDTQVVRAELPRLTIRPAAYSTNGSVTEVFMNVVTAQDDVVYHFESTSTFTDPWNEYFVQVRKGDTVRANVPSFGQTFFRLKAVLP